jgi:type VI protein secretion system component Hcp
MTTQSPKIPTHVTPQDLKDQAALLSFIDEMMKERNDPNITDKNREQMRAFLLYKANEAINTHLITLLSEEDLKELDQLLERNASNQELDEFFKRKIPNLAVEIATALLNFRAAYMFPVLKQEMEKNKQEETSLPPAPVGNKGN